MTTEYIFPLASSVSLLFCMSVIYRKLTLLLANSSFAFPELLDFIHGKLDIYPYVVEELNFALILFQEIVSQG